MTAPSLCPVCRDNRTKFLRIVKLGQEVTMDADTGRVLFADPEWETVTRRGKPDVELRCLVCDHTATAADFSRAARREDGRPPAYGRRRR